MSWQHHLYSKLGSKKPSQPIIGAVVSTKANANQQAMLDELVERIVAMAKVLYGLHTVNNYLYLEPMFRNVTCFAFTFIVRFLCSQFI